MAFLNTADEDDPIANNRCRVRGAALEDSDERPPTPVSDALALVQAIEPPRAGVRQITMPESIVPLLQADLERHVAVGADAPPFAGPEGGVRRASFYKAWHKAPI